MRCRSSKRCSQVLEKTQPAAEATSSSSSASARCEDQALIAVRQAAVRLVPGADPPGHADWNGSEEIERITPVASQSRSNGRSGLSSAGAGEHTKAHLEAAKARDVRKYSLAVLIDPKEKDSPSDPAEPQAFRQGSREKFSIDVEPIQKDDLDRLAEYDALWIRATTSIDNFTYRFARRAQQEGMPVIDDPQSMIRCTNKVYLAERLGAAGVPTPKTMIVPEREAGRRGRQGAGLADRAQDPRRLVQPRRVQGRQRRGSSGARSRRC